MKDKEVDNDETCDNCPVHKKEIPVPNVGCCRYGKNCCPRATGYGKHECKRRLSCRAWNGKPIGINTNTTYR